MMSEPLQYPLKWLAVTKDIKGHGYNALDFGWSNAHGGANVPIYASGAGVVEWVRDGRDNDYPSRSYGNNIRIVYDNGLTVFCAHILKNSFKVKVGDRVTRGQELCQMNNSGNSRGSHLHLEVLRNGVKLNPFEHLYAYDGETAIAAMTEKKYNILHYQADDKDRKIAELEAVITEQNEQMKTAVEVLGGQYERN